jgi:hypothetical protein
MAQHNIACADALASGGQGKDATHRDEKERARRRQQALDSLRAELEAFSKRLEKEADKARPEVIRQLQHRLGDSDFAGVRGEKALANLPAEERPGWRQLWADVEHTLAKARELTNGKEKSQKNR